tara:strand:- start:151 stop:912 length:762 start_codon:yes stop_codon:yes gene_type:complete
MEFNDEFNILGDFKRYIKDNNLALNIFNSYGNKECILNLNDIVEVFNISSHKMDEFLSNFKSEIIRITDLNKKLNSEQTEESKKTLKRIYSEFNGFFDIINSHIENEDSDSDSENEMELEKNFMKPFCFYRLNEDKLNENNLCIMNKVSKKLYNYKPPHDFYAKIDNSNDLILNEDENPEENISFYYEIKSSNDSENMFISGAGLSVLISESKKEYFENTRSFSRFIGIPSQLGLCAFKSIKNQYHLKKSQYS